MQKVLISFFKSVTPICEKRETDLSFEGIVDPRRNNNRDQETLQMS